MQLIKFSNLFPYVRVLTFTDLLLHKIIQTTDIILFLKFPIHVIIVIFFYNNPQLKSDILSKYIDFSLKTVICT